MYVYPYGDSQQLNLDWIINKLKELEDQETSAADLEEIANVFIALTHSSGTQYRRYDYCYYQGKLYRALNDNIGPFNASDWMEVRLGDDIPIITRLINAIDASAVFDVKFDTSGTNGKLQQKYNNAYHDVVEVDYTPVQNSKRPLSSNAGYDLKGAITQDEKDIAYIINGKRTSTTIPSGQYVLLRNSTIAGKTDGLYKAASAIPANTDLTASYLTDTTGGGLNQVTPIELGGTGKTNIESAALSLRNGINYNISVPANGAVKLSFTGATILFHSAIGSSPSTSSVYIFSGYSGKANLLEVFAPQSQGAVVFTQGNGYIELTNISNDTRNVSTLILQGDSSKIVITPST